MAKKYKKYYKQGIYSPAHPEKWILSKNSLPSNSKNLNTKIVYRSSWEYHFCKYCDNTSSIISVSSEPFPIEYYYSIDNKKHRYYPDFIIKVKDKQNNIKLHLIEIKPYQEVKDAMEGVVKRSNMKEYTFKKRTMTAMKNSAKWKAAKEFCKEKNMIFTIITEKELGLKNV